MFSPRLISVPVSVSVLATSMWIMPYYRRNLDDVIVDESLAVIIHLSQMDIIIKHLTIFFIYAICLFVSLKMDLLLHVQLGEKV